MERQMSTTPSPAAPILKPIAQAVTSSAAASRVAVPRPAAPVIKQRGYGLPCAKCRTYYSSELSSCPVCRHAERMKPIASPAPAAATAQRDDLKAIEQEREKFLREFKSQVYAKHMQINAAESFRCNLEANHQGGFEPAAVCQACYDQLKERADLMEAALHINAVDAAQIVYDAVWSDPSDPSKTYQHAAEALLIELRKRAGIPPVRGRHQPKAD